MLTFNPIALAPLLGGFLSVVLAIFSYQIRPGIGRRRATLLFLIITCYCLGAAAELCSTNADDALIWIKLEYLGISLAAPLWLSILITYSGYDELISRRLIALFFVIPVITLIIALSPLMIPVLYQGVSMNLAGAFPVTSIIPGPWYWVCVLNNLLCLFIGVGLLLFMFVRTGTLYRNQIILMLIGSIAPFISLILNITDSGPVPDLDLTPFALIISGMTLIPAISRYHFMDIIPVAHSMVLKKVPMGVLVLDDKNRIRELNPAGEEMIGVDSSSAVGRSASELIPGWDKMVEHLSDPQDGFEYHACKDGTHEIYQVNRIALEESAGIFTGSILLFSTITERKAEEARMAEYAGIIEARNHELEQLHQRLKEVNQDLDTQVNERTCEVEALLTQKDHFIEQLAHDLRSPLIPLVGLIPFLIELEKEPDITRLLVQMKSSVDLMRHTVEQVLDLARLNSMYSITDQVTYDISSLITAVINDLLPEIEQHQISIVSHIPSGLQVMLSPVHAKVIFRHVLSNAVRYNVMGGKVEIRGTREKGWVRIEVQDTGIGIDAEDLPRIFDEFYRTDSSRKNLEAKGLGLTIVRRMVTLNKGKIQAVSPGSGMGSTFYLCFPLAGECQDE